MITLALRTAYSRHVMRALRGGFEPMPLWQFHALTFTLGRVW